MKLTKAQRLILRFASDLGGTIRVFADQAPTVSRLEAVGYLRGNGRYFGRETTITPAGRAALEQEGK